MNEADDETQRFVSPSRPEERQQAALRHAFDEKQATLEERAALIKEKHGERLAKEISIAGVEDAEIVSLAVDHMAQSIAARGVEPTQISGEEFRRLGAQSRDSAYKVYDAEREQQGSVVPVADPMQGIEPHGLNYGNLSKTHDQVAEIEASNEVGHVRRDAQQDGRTADEPGHIPPVEQQAARDPLLPVEIQDHSPDGPVEARTGRVDRVAEFLKAESLDREARKSILQELGVAAGREITEQEGKEFSRDFGGGQSL